MKRGIVKRWLKVLGASVLLGAGVALAAATTPEIQQTSSYLQQQSNQVLSQYVTGTVGADPFGTMFGQGSAIASSGLYKMWVTLAVLIAIVGFAKSVADIQFADGDAMKRFSLIAGRWLVTTALISSAYANTSWSIHHVLTTTASSSYNFGLTTFAGDFDKKLDETRSSFSDMLGATVVVGTTLALPEGAAALKASSVAMAKTFAAGGSRVAAARESAVAAKSGIASAGKKVVGFVMDRLGGMFLALQYFMGGYATLITASGWMTVIMLLALPIGLALINFGETRVLWSIFGTWLGQMMALMLMPLVLVHALDTALVAPTKSMDYYTQQLGMQAQLQREQAQTAQQSTQSEMDRMLAQCKDARNADPANVDSNPCQKVVNQGALVTFTDWLGGSVAQKIGDAIEGIVANIADSFVSFGVMLARLLVGLGLASLLMFGVPVAAITMFSGVAVRK